MTDVNVVFLCDNLCWNALFPTSGRAEDALSVDSHRFLNTSSFGSLSNRPNVQHRIQQLQPFGGIVLCVALSKLFEGEYDSFAQILQQQLGHQTTVIALNLSPTQAKQTLKLMMAHTRDRLKWPEQSNRMVIVNITKYEDVISALIQKSLKALTTSKTTTTTFLQNVSSITQNASSVSKSGVVTIPRSYLAIGLLLLIVAVLLFKLSAANQNLIEANQKLEIKQKTIQELLIRINEIEKEYTREMDLVNIEHQELIECRSKIVTLEWKYDLCNSGPIRTKRK
eukprot:TRINITY_DN8796_c0_g1_i2.p1 TRINITY_DN8796_c0_g1~~TRINITY_DN8796_c0_g1_i2.p1  ORF type:complete len:282 (-),score=42.07 TRINITY_DN8796_c0_g1_i2:66-911(-)